MSVKLYRNNKSGEVVAACVKHDIAYIFNGSNVKNMIEGHFLLSYTAMPEAPEVGSTAWAIMMMEKGHKVTSASFDQHTLKYLYVEGGLVYCNNGKLKDYLHLDNKYKLYTPMPIVECLPHESSRRDIVLVRDGISKCWSKREFASYEPQKLSGNFYIKPHDIHSLCDRFNYCLPYAENAHLEGQITDGEHGAVPRGYVPPHVPQLVDETYWMVGDEIINLVTGKSAIVTKVTNECVELDYDGLFASIPLIGAKGKGLLRGWYHKGSYVREDGTVHEHIPTRPHRIES